MAGNDQIDQRANEILDHIHNKDGSGLIDELHQLRGTPEYQQILAKANQTLEAKLHVDLIGDTDPQGGTDDHALFKKQSGGNLEVTRDWKILQSGAASQPGDAGAHKTVINGLDGQPSAVVESQVQADGKSHPTKITHQDGQVTAYTYGADGQPNGISEYSKDGTLVSQYNKGSGDTWTQQVPGANANGIPLPKETHGTLTVDDKGTHTFTNPDGSKLVRTADGSFWGVNVHGKGGILLPAGARNTDALTKAAQDQPQPVAQPGDGSHPPQPGAPPADAGGGGGPGTNEPFKPKGQDGAYNPVGPPGLGEFDKGDHNYWQRKVDGHYGIDRRDLDGTERNDADKTTNYRYHGKLNDGWLSDTKFEGSERYTDDGKLVERHVKYDGDGAKITFKTDSGNKEIKDVQTIDTGFDAKSGNYVTTIVTHDGTRYKALTAPDGTVKSFKETTDAEQTQAPGLTNTKVDQFKANGDVFNPVRPNGIAQLHPGEAVDGSKDGVGKRYSRGEQNDDGTTTYRYDSAKLNDWGFMPWNWTNTHYTGSETMDKQGNLVKSDITYDSAKDQDFQGPRGQKVHVDNVVNVETTRTESGAYVTHVRNKDGKVYTFTTGADGVVTDYKAP